MKQLLTISLIAVLALALSIALGGSSAQNDLAFTGTVYAIPGGIVKGTAMVACLLEGRDCNQNGSREEIIQDTGQSATFSLSALKPRPYWLLAWRDLNYDGEVNQGDEVAVYTQAGKPALLTPPAAKIELRLKVLNGDFDTLLPQANRVPPAPPHHLLRHRPRVPPIARVRRSKP
jgi:hypothetical protein